MESGLSIDFNTNGLTKEDDSDLDLHEEEQQRQLANLLENAFDDLVEYDDDDISADETGLMPNMSCNESHNLNADDSHDDSDSSSDHKHVDMEARCFDAARSDTRHFFGRSDMGAYIVGWPHHPALTNFGEGSAVPSTQLATGGSPDTSFEPSVLYSSGMGGGVSSATSLCSSRPNDSLFLPPILPPRNVRQVALGGAQRYLAHPALQVVETADACVEAIPENQREFDQLEILFKNRGRVIEQMRSSHEDHLKEARALRHRATLAESELEASRKQYADTLCRLTSVQHDVNALHLNEKRFEQERVALQQTLAAAEQRAANQEANIHMLQEQLVSAQSLESLSKAKAAQEHLVRALRARADQESAALRTELDLAQEKIGRLTADLASSRSLADSALAERTAQLERQAVQLEAAQSKVGALLASQNGQEVARLRLELSQLGSSKAITDDLNQVLQQEIRDLKEQIGMLEKVGGFHCSADDDAAAVRLDFSDADAATEESPKSDKEQVFSTSEEVILLRQELIRCVGKYSAKSVQLTSLQEDMLGARRDAVDWQRRAERVELLLEEKREELLACELRLSKLEAPTAPSAKEAQLIQELSQLDEVNAQLQLQLADVRLRFEELVNSEERLSEQNEELQRHLSQLVDQYDEDKRDSVERVRQTCERHYDACRERMREELLREAANERERVVGQLNAQLEDAVLKLRQAQESYLQLAEEKATNEKQAAAQLTAQLELTERRLVELRALLAAQVELAVDEARRAWQEEAAAQLNKQDLELRAFSAAQVDEARRAWQEEAASQLNKQELELRAFSSAQVELAVNEARQVWLKEAETLSNAKISQVTQQVALEVSEMRQVFEEREATLRAECAQLKDLNTKEAAAGIERAMQESAHLKERLTVIECENIRLTQDVQFERTQFETDLEQLRMKLSAALSQADSQRIELIASHEAAFARQRAEFATYEEQHACELSAAKQQLAELKKREVELGARAAQLEALGVEVEVCVQERQRARQEKDVLRKAARDARADCERLQLELARTETLWEERLRDTKSRLEAQFRGRFREYAARREQDYQERLLLHHQSVASAAHSSSAVQTSPSQEKRSYLHTLNQIRDDVMKHVSESQSRAAHTLQAELVQAQRDICRQHALRLRNQLLSNSATSSEAATSSPVLQLLHRFVQQDSMDMSDELRKKSSSSSLNASTDHSRVLQSSTPERASSFRSDIATTMYHNRFADLTNISLCDATVTAVARSKQINSARRNATFQLRIS